MCWNAEAPIVDIRVFKNSKKYQIKRLHYEDAHHKPIVIEEKDYEAGDKFFIQIQYDWYNG